MTRKPLLLAVVAAMIACPVLANASPITYRTTLSGANEAPPNASPATGWAEVIVDDVAHTMSVEVSFSGLIGNVTAAHIHCCTADPGVGVAGVATQTPSFIGFPAGVTAGSYFQTFDMTLASSYRAGFIGADGTPSTAELALFQGLADGKAYFNIHTTVYPGGEIRGFLEPVPEPASMILFGTGLAGVLARARKRRD
jgi:hypothetical protein